MNIDALSAVSQQVFTPASTIAPAAAQRPSRETPAAAPATIESATPPPVEEVKASAQQIESYLKSSGRQLEFRVDDGSGELVVSVRDATTGDLIRQIPGDTVLQMARSLKENPVSLINLMA